MEKVGEDEEKTTIEEASNSVEETRSDKEDERTRDYTEEESTDPSNSQTVVTFEDHEVNDDEMEDEKVLELFRRNSGLRPEVTERNNFMNKSEEMVLEFQEDTRAETETQETVFHSCAVNLNSPKILEGTKSSSDSSSNSDLDSNLSRYYFDGSLPVSAHVQESETDQDEYSVPKDETKMLLLCPKQPLMQPTSWRNCCGLLELLRAADP